MRIGIVARHLGLPVGFGTYADRMLHALPAVAPSVCVELYAPVDPWHGSPPPGVRLHVVRRPAIERRLRWWEVAASARAVLSERCDLVHFFSPWSAPVGLPKPVVVNIFDAIPWRLADYRVDPRHLAQVERRARGAQRVITLSEAARTDLVDVLGIPSDRLVVTPLAGPDPTPAPDSTRRADSGGGYWLFVGGTERRKNLRLVLDALALPGAPTLKLQIVGTSAAGPLRDDRSALEAGVPDGVRGRLRWLGPVDNAELASLYAEATALVFPSRYEGFGLPVLEAMARGTPVVAADASSLPELTDGAALLVDPDDPAALRDALARLSRDAPLRERMSAAGREVAGRYSWERTGRETFAVYRELLGR